MIDADTSRRGNFANNGLAAPIFRSESFFLKLFFDSLNVGGGQIDLIDRDHDLHVRSGLGVTDRFQRLRHQAIVGRDNEHHDVGDLSATRPHRCERSMPRRIDKGNPGAFVIDAVGADVLRNSAGFARRHARLANRIQK